MILRSRDRDGRSRQRVPRLEHPRPLQARAYLDDNVAYRLSSTTTTMTCIVEIENQRSGRLSVGVRNEPERRADRRSKLNAN